MSNALAGFNAITDLMHKIQSSGNQFPKVRLAFDGAPLVLTVAGSRSRNPGAVNLTDGAGYGAGVFYGKISTDGVFEPTAAASGLGIEAKRALWAILKRMRDGEAESVFAEHGKAVGCCCMCGRDLSNQESVELGIGPICRERAFG